MNHDHIDRREQSQEPYQFATPETKARCNRILKGGGLATDADPILAWVEDRQISPQAGEDAHEIRKCLVYVRSQVAGKTLNYYSIDCPGAHGHGDARQPKSWPRYMAWSGKIIQAFGHGGLNMIQDCIMDGVPCDVKLFRVAMRRF